MQIIFIWYRQNSCQIFTKANTHFVNYSCQETDLVASVIQFSNDNSSFKSHRSRSLIKSMICSGRESFFVFSRLEINLPYQNRLLMKDIIHFFVIRHSRRIENTTFLPISDRNSLYITPDLAHNSSEFMSQGDTFCGRELPSEDMKIGSTYSRESNLQEDLIWRWNMRNWSSYKGQLIVPQLYCSVHLSRQVKSDVPEGLVTSCFVYVTQMGHMSRNICVTLSCERLYCSF